LAQSNEVTLLTQRIDNGPTNTLSDSLRPPPTFDPFVDAGVHIVPLRYTNAQRLRMTPSAVGRVMPGLRRYAHGRMRVPMATSYAHVAAPVIARQARVADVVHVWGGDFPCVAAVRAANSTKTPAVVTPFAHRGQWNDDPASARAYRRAAAVIGLLQTDCDLLRDLGVAPGNVTECPVCSPGVRRGGGEDWRRAHGVDGPLVAFLGVRRAYKGVQILIDAIPELGALRPDATVVFAGPGDPVSGSHTLRVIDRGLVSEAERAAILEAADVLCLPSAGEIFPVTILEAWSAKTAVVTSDIPPLRELMARSGGGVAVPRTPSALAAAVAQLLTGGSGRCAESGYRYWQRHATVEAVVSRHEAIYRSVIGGTALAAATEPGASS
jgi:glycosyltransferase involved in cell wall biosynthesis